MIRYVFDGPLTIPNAKLANAQKIGEALAEIGLTKGGLTPSKVVEAASEPRHILHRHFTWDNLVAAARWRLEEARTIVQIISVKDAAGEDGQVRAFISVTDKNGSQYHPISEVKKNPDLREAVLAAAQRDLETFETRYRALRDVCQVVRQARTIVAEKRKKVESRTQA